MYNPYDHYWLRADGSIYSSARQTYLTGDDPQYLAWRAAGGYPTAYPRDEHGEESEDVLARVLAPYGLLTLPPTLATLYSAKQVEIRDAADAFLAPFRAEYGVVEMATWDQQYAEAQALQADAEAAAPLVRSIAAARGMDVAVLAGRIIANRATWMILSGHVIGQRLAYQDQLDAAHAAEDVAAMLAIEPMYELPGS